MRPDHPPWCRHCDEPNYSTPRVRPWRQSDGPAPGMLVEIDCPVCGLEMEWVNGAVPTGAEGTAILVCPKGHETQLMVRLIPVRAGARPASHPSEVGLAS